MALKGLQQGTAERVRDTQTGMAQGRGWLMLQQPLAKFSEASLVWAEQAARADAMCSTSITGRCKQAFGTATWCRCRQACNLSRQIGMA